MNRKIFVAAVFILLAFLSSASFSCLAEGNSELTVHPDVAQIDPYTQALTSDMDSLAVTQSNVVYDGNGYTVARGIFGMYVTNVTIRNFLNTKIHVEMCSNVNIINNVCTDIEVWGGASNVVSGNLIVGGGIDLDWWSSNNKVFCNNVTGFAKYHGLWIRASDNNTFWGNNFMSNVTIFGLASADLGNTFDNGKVGNYWSNYNGTDANGDGIGDSAYVLSANNSDYIPLMSPYTSENRFQPIPTHNPTPTPTSHSPSPSTSLPQNPSPSPSPSPNPSPSSSPTPLASSSPEITVEPTPTTHDIQVENVAPEIIMLALAAAVAIVGLLIYFKRRTAKA